MKIKTDTESILKQQKRNLETTNNSLDRKQKKTFPKGLLFIGGTVLIVALSNYGVTRMQDEKHWNQTTIQNTAKSYADYSILRPQGRYAAEAQILFGERSFSEAYAKAVKVVEQAKKTRNRQDWEKVVDGWETVIQQLKEVPDTSSSFAKAQQKIQEYQQNLEYARIKSIDTYPEFYAQAVKVVELEQKAQNRDDWRHIVNRWQDVIKLMKTVPEKSPNFQLSQQKAQAYQNNLASARIKYIDTLVISGADYLDANANWTNINEARTIYDSLKGLNSELVTSSLVKQIRQLKNRRQILFLSIKLGIEGSQEKLNKVLLNYGDKSMAEDFLNSNSDKLYEGGKKWASLRGYTIHTYKKNSKNRPISWGNF